MQLGDIRNEYNYTPLSEEDVDENPLKQLEIWLKEALDKKLPEPTAMSVSTFSGNRISSRIVLLKQLTPDGLVFFTDFTSRKAHDLSQNSEIAALFFYPELFRQIRIEGEVVKISDEEATEYFDSRPRNSKISAIISEQSSIVPNRLFLEHKWNIWSKKNDNELKKPQNWGGYKIIPNYFEFWQGRKNRLHDRIVYERMPENWQIKRLAP